MNTVMRSIRPTMSVVTLLLLFSYSAWLVHAQSQCQPVSGKPGCVCQHPDGIIDLTKIANNDGTPRFSDGLEDESDYSYDFNPCYKYSDVLCSNVFICQKPNFDPGYSYVIADDQEKIMMDPTDTRGKVYLHYTGPGPIEGVQRESKVYLHCDQSRTTPYATAEGDAAQILNYIFDLYSCAACPGGCEGGGGGGGGGGSGGGGGGGGGIEQGVLIAVAVVAAVSIVPCVIIIILCALVVVLLVHSRSRRDHDIRQPLVKK